jgi:DNA-binding NarL/FixJ family response regulator
MPRSRPALILKAADEQQLRQWVAALGTPHQVAMRSRIVLAAATGQPDSEIAQELAVNRNTVTRESRA